MPSPILHAVSAPLLAGGGPLELVALGAAAATVAADTGDSCTDDVSSESGRALLIATDATDNDCITASWGGALKMAVGNRFGFTAKMSLTEGNTNDADWFIGWSDVVSTSFFGDDEVLASMDAIGFYKIKDSMFFRTCVLNATVQGGATLTTAFASATQYTLRVIGEVGTLGFTCKFYVDEALVATVSNTTITNMSKMVPVVSVANGGANAENLLLFSFQPYCS